jgi:hypothetical protein
MVILDPAGYSSTRAVDVAENIQVGEGFSNADGSRRHALLWRGTAESVVDLHQYLGSAFVNSTATGIDSNGDIVGSAYDGSSIFAVKWSLVPEPSTAVMASFLPMSFFCVRRRTSG